MGTPITNMTDLGQTLTEHEIKKGLRELNPDLTFDPGTKLGIYHPRQDQWQGIWYRERHITSMGRGVIPEYHVWGTMRGKDGLPVMVRVEAIGWRHTFLMLVRARIPKITWRSLCAKFKFQYKQQFIAPGKQETVQIGA